MSLLSLARYIQALGRAVRPDMDPKIREVREKELAEAIQLFNEEVEKEPKSNG